MLPLRRPFRVFPHNLYIVYLRKNLLSLFFLFFILTIYFFCFHEIVFPFIFFFSLFGYSYREKKKKYLVRKSLYERNRFIKVFAAHSPRKNRVDEACCVFCMCKSIGLLVSRAPVAHAYVFPACANTPTQWIVHIGTS